MLSKLKPHKEVENQVETCLNKNNLQHCITNIDYNAKREEETCNEQHQLDIEAQRISNLAQPTSEKLIFNSCTKKHQ